MQQFRNTLRKAAAIGTSVAMLGMTVTGALAADLTLADYPQPFQNGGNTMFVYGATASGQDVEAATNILSGLPAGSSSSGSSSSSSGNVGTNAGSVTLDKKYTKDFVLGTALDASTAFGTEVRDTTLPSLTSGSTLISIGSVSNTYDLHERVNFTSNAFVGTGLTLGSINYSSQDYGKNVVLRLGENSVEYSLKFDSSLNEGNYISNASSTYPIQLNFLGKTLEIEGATATTLTAIAGDKFSMEAMDSVVVGGKKVTVDSIGTSSVKVTVDGVSDVISSTTTKTVNGLSVKVRDVINVGADTSAGKSSTTLIVAEAKDTSAVKTYNDNDHFIGQDKYNPLWRWDLGSLNTATPTLGVTLGQSLTSSSISGIPDYALSHPPYVGDVLCLPNNYVCLTIESVSQSDDGFGKYELMPVQKTLYLNTTATSSLRSDAQVVRFSSLSTTAGTGFKANGSIESNELYVQSEATNAGVNVFYWDKTTARPILYANYTTNNTAFNTVSLGTINYKSTILPVYLVMSNATYQVAAVSGLGDWADAYKGVGFELCTAPTTCTSTSNSSLAANQFKIVINDTSGGYDQLQVFFRETSTGAIQHLGHRPNGGTYASNDVLYVPASGGNLIDLSSYTSDVRLKSGVVLLNPRNGVEADRLQFLVPSDSTNYKATVSVATTTGGSKPTLVKGTVASASSSIMMKDTDVSDLTMYNAIVVGGPAINKAAADLLGVPYPSYGANSGLTENEAVVQLKKQSSGTYALLVAGWEAADTQRAGVVLRNYNQFKSTLKGTSVSVKGTSMDVSGITVM